MQPTLRFNKRTTFLFAAALLTLVGKSPANEPVPAGGGLRRISAADPLVDYREKWAVIVGINDYSRGQGFENLQNATNDAREFRKLLVEEFGYDDAHIHYLTDLEGEPKDIVDGRPTHAAVRAAFKEWLPTQKPRTDDAVLVFFAGHGVRDSKGEGHVAVADSRTEDLKETCIPIGWIRDRLQDDKAVLSLHKLLILDCCFSGTLFEFSRPLVAQQAAVGEEPARGEIGYYLSRMAFVGMSAGLGDQPVADGVGRENHSVFTKSLLQAMRERTNSRRPDHVFTFTDLAADLRPRVAADVLRRDALSNQIPMAGRIESGEGDFVFRQSKDVEVPWEIGLVNERRAILNRYDVQMVSISRALPADPGRALELLGDVANCPDHLVDFTWRYFYRLSRRDRYEWRTGQGAIKFLAAIGSPLRLISGGRDGTLQLWDPTRRAIVKTIGKRETAITTGMLSPDGKTVAIGYFDGLTKVFKTDDWSEAREPIPCPKDAGPVSAIAISALGELVIGHGLPGVDPEVTRAGGPVWLYDKDRGRELLDLRGAAWCLAFTSDGRAVLAGGDGPLRIKSLVNGKLTAPKDDAWPDGATEIVPVGSEGRFFVPSAVGFFFEIDITKGRSQRLIGNADTGDYTRMGIHQGGTLLAAGLDYRGRLITAGKGIGEHGHRPFQPVVYRNPFDLSITAYPAEMRYAPERLAPSRTSPHLAVSTADLISFWDMSDEVEANSTLLIHENSLKGVDFDMEGKRLVTYPLGATVLEKGKGLQYWSVEGEKLPWPKGFDDQLLIPLEGQGRILSLAKSQMEGRLDVSVRDVFSGETQGTINVDRPFSGVVAASLSEERKLKYLVFRKSDYLDVVGFPDGRQIQKIKLDPAAPAEKKVVPSDDDELEVNSIVVATASPSGRYLAVANVAVYAQSVVSIWDLELKRKASQFTSPGAICLAFSPDETQLALGGTEQQSGFSNYQELLRGKVKIDSVESGVWDVSSGRQIAALKGHDRNVRGIAYSPDGLTLATGGEDRTVRLWDPYTGNQRAVLQGHQGTSFGLTFSPDGRYLASASYDSTVRIFSADCDDLFDRHEVQELLTKHLEENEKSTMKVDSIRAIEDDPSFRQFIRNRAAGQALNRAGWQIVSDPSRTRSDYLLALGKAERASWKLPNDGHVLNTLGVALYRAERYREAIETLRESLRICTDPTDGPHPSDLAFLAMAEWRAGKLDDARMHLALLKQAVLSERWRNDHLVGAMYKETASIITEPR